MNPFRSLVKALRRKADLNDELKSHLRMAVADRVMSGQSLADARREVLREFGNMALIAVVTREEWGWIWLEHFVQDLHYATRQLRRSPAFTATTLLTLMLAIGANTAIFSLAYALLLKTLPVAHPKQIVQVQMKLRSRMGKGEWNRASPVNSGGLFDALSEQQRSFSGMCAWERNSLDLSENGVTQPLDAALITGDCFRTLGLKPALGRLFTEAEDREGGGPQGYPIVLSYDFWRSRFGGDPNVLGKQLLFEKTPAVVVGVAPRNFRSITVGEAPLLYAPSEIGDHQERHAFGSFNRIIVGRLKTGVLLSHAAAQLDSSYNAWIDAIHPEWRKNSEDFSGVYAEQHVLLKPRRTGYSYFAEPDCIARGSCGRSAAASAESSLDRPNGCTSDGVSADISG